jgi:hypothetical protein
MSDMLAFLMLCWVVSTTVSTAFTAGRDGDTMEVKGGQTRWLAV